MFEGIASTVIVAHDYAVSVTQELLARREEGTDVPLAFVWEMLDRVPGAHMAARVRECLPARRSSRSMTSDTGPRWKRLSGW